MAETEREEAKRRRAEDRKRRREGAQGQAGGNSETAEPLDSVKHAAKVAAAAAAVGAAVGAARALTDDGSDDGSDKEPESAEPVAEQEREPEPEPANEQPRLEEREEERQPHEHYDEGQPSGASPDEARRVVASAREALAALLGKEPESVSGLDRNGDGWLVTLEVVELARIPESTDVLASYELELDGDRRLVRYQRGRRYYRSQANDGDTS